MYHSISGVLCRAESEHRGQCTQSLASEVGFICSCDAGYTSVASAPGGIGGECRDVNECTVYPTLCNRGDLARNACRNTDGSFECEENINNECTPENDYGGCWRQDVGGFTVTSCVVRTAHFCVSCALSVFCSPHAVVLCEAFIHSPGCFVALQIIRVEQLYVTR